MPLYRAKVRCFVDNGMREEGAVFEYKGPLNTNLELVDKTGAQDVELVESPKKGKPKAKQLTDDSVLAG